MMAKGMIHAEGTRLVDASGAPFQVRGINLGNWFVPEMYMSAAAPLTPGSTPWPGRSVPCAPIPT